MCEGTTIQHPLVLYRVDPKEDVARFYALMIERDLFGQTVLVRRWGRIGGRGRERAEGHADEGEAEKTMDQIVAAKRRRGDRDL